VIYAFCTGGCVVAIVGELAVAGRHKTHASRSKLSFVRVGVCCALALQIEARPRVRVVVLGRSLSHVDTY